jgi:hypothetical protein
MGLLAPDSLIETGLANLNYVTFRTLFWKPGVGNRVNPLLM